MLDRREPEGFWRFFCKWEKWIDMIKDRRYNIESNLISTCLERYKL